MSRFVAGYYQRSAQSVHLAKRFDTALTAERDALFRLLTQLADGIDEVRAEERRHVKALEKARKWVEALQLLFRMFEKALPPGPEATPIPSAAQIRRFLDCFEILSRFDIESRFIRGIGAGFDSQEWPERPDPDVIAVRMWLSALAGEEPARALESRNDQTEASFEDGDLTGHWALLSSTSFLRSPLRYLKEAAAGCVIEIGLSADDTVVIRRGNPLDSMPNPQES